MMQLFLAHHMFMHLSCIHTLSFLSISVLGCDCVSSLSLSLLDRLRLAFKRKFASVQNPLRFKSSSSNLPPTHVQFRDEKAHQDFSDNFYKRGVHLECHVILLDFSNTTLPDVIYTWGWESLCEIPLRCPIMII